MKTSGNFFELVHHRIFEAFDSTVRVQLSLVGDLLDLNRKRFETLYAGTGLMDKISVHQDLATELGKRTATWAGDLQEVAFNFYSGAWDAVNNRVPTVASKSRSGRTGKQRDSRED
jgi:hypothetical protein